MTFRSFNNVCRKKNLDWWAWLWFKDFEILFAKAKLFSLKVFPFIFSWILSYPFDLIFSLIHLQLCPIKTLYSWKNCLSAYIYVLDWYIPLKMQFSYKYFWCGLYIYRIVSYAPWVAKCDAFNHFWGPSSSKRRRLLELKKFHITSVVACSKKRLTIRDALLLGLYNFIDIQKKILDIVRLEWYNTSADILADLNS